MAKKRTADTDPRWTLKQRPAPGDLRIVQALLNTVDVVRGTDLEGPRALADWLELWSLVPPGTRLGDGDLERTRAVRDALREWVASQHGEAASEEAAARLDREMAAATIRPRFGADGRVRYEPASGGLDAALARLGKIVADAQLEDAWRHMKICFDENCRAVFFDHSKSHTAKRCSPQCSSRRTSLTYRHRNLRRIRDRDRRNARYRR